MARTRSRPVTSSCPVIYQSRVRPAPAYPIGRSGLPASSARRVASPATPLELFEASACPRLVACSAVEGCSKGPPRTWIQLDRSSALSPVRNFIPQAVVYRSANKHPPPCADKWTERHTTGSIQSRKTTDSTTTDRGKATSPRPHRTATRRSMSWPRPPNASRSPNG